MAETTDKAVALATCPKCGGAGEFASGEIYHWGDPVMAQCDCVPDPTIATLTADNARLQSALAAMQADRDAAVEALKPFARICEAVVNTNLRDGEVVHRQHYPQGDPSSPFQELYREDFRRARAALAIPTTEED